MTRFGSIPSDRRSARLLAALLIVATACGACGVATAAAPGHIDFNQADLPPATVEVDLSQGMFGSLFGIGDAALAGVGQSLSESADGAEDIQMAADKLAAARELVQLASELVEEARVRVYEDFGDQAGDVEALFAKFDSQLRDGNWENVVRVRDGNDNVRVSLLRDENAIRGVLVVAGDGGDLVLVNICCDVSPDRVKQLTATATKIGLENGLRPMLQAHMHQLRPQFQHGPQHAQRDR